MDAAAGGQDECFAGEANLVLVIRPFAQHKCILAARVDTEVRGPVHAEPVTDGALLAGAEAHDNHFVGHGCEDFARIAHAIHRVGHSHDAGVKIKLVAVLADGSIVRAVQIEIAQCAVAGHSRRDADHVVLDELFSGRDLVAVESLRLEQQLANLRNSFVSPRIQAVRTAALPQRGFVQLQVFIRARGPRSIQQRSVQTGKLLVSIILAGVCSAKDHRAQAAVSYRKSMIPDGSGSPVAEHIA